MRFIAPRKNYIFFHVFFSLHKPSKYTGRKRQIMGLRDRRFSSFLTACACTHSGGQSTVRQLIVSGHNRTRLYNRSFLSSFYNTKQCQWLGWYLKKDQQLSQATKVYIIIYCRRKWHYLPYYRLFILRYEHLCVSFNASGLFCDSVAHISSARER